MEVVQPDPPLSDGLVLLRPWDDGDVDALVSGINGDPDVTHAWTDHNIQDDSVRQSNVRGTIT